ncbi:YHS domain-containing protein [Chitinophaga agrisoli]|nr:YHS domain-containing protein [Chitinophaga agrisoli]
MKKLCYIVFFAGALMACGSSNTQQPAMTAQQEDTVAATLIADGKMGDPVCQMPYDTSYHEFSVYKGDTVNFCSPTCKGVFDKNPDKYAVNLK